jgi:hypothetical protein
MTTVSARRHDDVVNEKKKTVQLYIVSVFFGRNDGTPVADQAQPHDVHFGGPVTGKLDTYSRNCVRVMGRTFATPLF